MDAAELLRRYGDGERDFAGAKLARVNLRDAVLVGIDLHDADLREADLCGADLSNADLSDAYLGEALLAEAKLCGAKLCRADCREADLADADLTGADVTGARFLDADLRRAKLSQTIGLTQEQLYSTVSYADAELPPGMKPETR